MNPSKRKYPNGPLRWQNRLTQAGRSRAGLLQERDQEYA